MNFLKRIPIKYLGELHDVRLINFSVDMQEVKDKVPAPIQVRNVNGRALFSMVDVKLKKMHPAFVPSFLHFEYRHVAFRLLVDDSMYNKGAHKGIYFYQSFTDKPFIVTGGRLFTDYNLETAFINEEGNTVTISQGKNKINYSLGKLLEKKEQKQELQSMIGTLDRAYSVLEDTVRVTQIQREKWPIQQVACTDFRTDFFTSAKLEGAFRVLETIYYQWLPPKSVQL